MTVRSPRQPYPEQLAERLLVWVDTPLLGRHELPYANPAQLKADVRALLADRERLERERDEAREDFDMARASADVVAAALMRAQHWHEQLDYDEALNVIDAALAAAGEPAPEETPDG